MGNIIRLNFYKRPNGPIVPILALFGMNKWSRDGASFSTISAKWSGAKLTDKQLFQFNRLCNINHTQSTSIVLPLSFIYPLIQRILARREAPLSLFQVLNTRIQVFQHRAIRIDEMLDIACETRTPRIRPKGLELDITSTIKSGNETRWESVLTFYYRGQFGKSDESHKSLELDPIVGGDTIAQWFLSEKVGLRFARISGDWNGIHYSKRYAQMLGFERDFAQPLLVLAKVADYLIDVDSEERTALDVRLKGQLYYERKVTLKGATIDNDTRFDVYSEGNPRPSISGRIEKR